MSILKLQVSSLEDTTFSNRRQAVIDQQKESSMLE